MAKREETETHWVATPADPDRPQGPRSWAKLDMSHPVEKMLRRVFTRPNVTFEEKARALARYRAAQVWYKLFLRAYGLDGYNALLGDLVDGSSDPQARQNAMMDAVRERLCVLDVPAMTTRRFDDLDSVVGYGNTVTEQARRSGRDPKTVRESVIAGLDAVSGFARWDRQMQAVQVVASYPVKNDTKKKVA